jgi:formate hydrogenlyase transcriptional activator
MVVSKMVFNKLSKTVLTILLLSIYSSIAWGEVPQVVLTTQEKAWLKAHPNIKLGYTDAYEPEVIVDSEGQYDGFLVDFLDELNKRLGTHVKLEIDTVKNIVEKAVGKEIDGILSLHPEYADKLGLLKTKGYISGFPAVFSNQTISFEQPDDFVGKRVAIIDKAYFSEKIIQPYEHEVTILRVTDALEGLQLVNKGQADVFIGATLSNYLVSKYQLVGIVSKYVFFDYPDKFSIAVRSDWPEFVSILNKAIDSFTETEINNIVTKWIKIEPKKTKTYLTSEERTWLKAHPEIYIGLPERLSPYVLADPKGNQIGILVDFRNELNRVIGANFILKTMPSSRILEMSKNKEIDVIYAIESDKADQEELLKTNIWATGFPAVFTRKGLSINKLDDLAGKTIVIRPNTDWARRIIQPYSESVKIVYAEAPVDAMEMLINEEADIYIGFTSHAYTITEYRLIGITQTYIVPDIKVPLVMGVRDDWPLLVSILNKGLKSIGREGLGTIVKNWLESNEESQSILLTDEEEAWLSKNHTVQVRIVDIPPYIIVKNSEKIEGISIDYLKLISERTGVKFQYKFTTKMFPEALDGLKKHQSPDLITSMMRTPEREKSILFSKDYFRSPYVIFSHTDNNKFITEISDLFGEKIALPKGTVIHKKIKMAHPEIELALFDTDAKAIEAVALKKADAYIGNLTLASYIILEKGLTSLKIAGPSPFGDHIFSMGIRNDWPELVTIIDKVIADISIAQHTKIRNKYISIIYEKLNTSVILKWILIICAIGLGILFIFALWNRSLASKIKLRTSDLGNSNQRLKAEIDDRKQAEHSLIEAYEEIKSLKEHIEAENTYLRDEIQTEHNFSEIVGNSEGLRYVLFKVEQVAPTDSTVLILGETGTGKELVARAIHSTSPRSARPLIKVNCAALPTHLIESELFGHEKGAFTGATEKRMGRFELANGGTLFLDEIGELPLELQAKLLMVLQDGVFERVGSSRSIKVDVRLMAATNRDLEAEIQNGHFRQDLFYRLNVYSLTIPPLRERKEDIPILVETFMNDYGKKLGKQVNRITQKTMNALSAHSWPGNIRELQNIIEKAVIITQDNTLRVDLPKSQIPPDMTDKGFKSLEEIEREYIQETLQLKNWRIDGPQGAAIILDLKPSTLRFRMKKLGIKRPL